MATLAEIIKRKKIAADPGAANYEYLKRLETLTEEAIQERIVEILDENKAKFNALFADLEKKMRGEADAAVAAFIARVPKMREEIVRDLKGEDGYTPIKGKDYFDGKQGERGLRGESVMGPQGPKGDSVAGPQGPAGSPDTPNEVVGKVNKAEKKIRVESIQKLPSILQGLREAIREAGRQRGGGGGGGGGGGMGNWVHETPSGVVNGSNTVFAASQHIASNGRALIVLINGQPQRLTAHYTVSGKTITFLTAPETGDVVFFIYVR